tara:strand:- start:229 stop:612 length:384 start_codon:yes stop_codon:yes gene_type:complete
MNNLLFSVSIITALVTLGSCDNCEEEIIPDRYYLIEVLADPGDGSGTFLPVESDKYLEFHTDGTITSNGELCSMGVESDSPSFGNYNQDTNTITTTSWCLELSYEMDGDEVILIYQCFEACRSKFIK